MLKLNQLCELPADATAVGWDKGQDRAELGRRQAAWRACMQGSLDGRVALFLEDGFEFCAALLAAWSEGLTVVLPGENTPATCENLKAQASMWAGDLDLPGVRRPGSAVQDGPLKAFPPIPVIVFTSGSTGLPQAIPKKRSQLESELESLEACFGELCGRSAFLSTVPHQHIYGLLFKALWPLASGRPSLSQVLRFPEEVQARAAQGPCTLLSSPAFLKRLEGSVADAWAPSAQHLAAVFSSGGPLSWSAVTRTRSLLGTVPSEVFGSSETGGIAWRRRQVEDAPWQALPGVSVKVDEHGTLKVLSPHLDPERWVATEDRAEILGEGFRLLGRADRVVKVEEKRVSLGALERALIRHPLVAEARVLLLTGKRENLGAVVVLKEHGVKQDHASRMAWIQDLREFLARSFERVALPRRWRFVLALPANALGKTTLADLQALFEDEGGLRPEILDRRLAEDEAEIELHLQAGLWAFKGHFPTVALLPGVVQLQWAVDQAEACFGLKGPFQGISALKFTKPTFPGTTLTLRLKRLPDALGFAFEYRSEAGKHSSGKVLRG